MTAPTDVLWECRPHTRAKHTILRSYLDAWLPILGTTFPVVHLVDGFAGPGRYTGGEMGSPLIMLDAFLGHTARDRSPPTCATFSLRRTSGGLATSRGRWPS